MIGVAWSACRNSRHSVEDGSIHCQCADLSLDHLIGRSLACPVSKLCVGVHVSVGKGLPAAVEHAQALGCRTMQIFAKSPRGWAASPLAQEAVDRACELRERYGIRPLAVHASYLINLAASDPAVYERSITGLQEELERSARLGADFLVVHVGCTKPGQGDGLQRVIHALETVLE